VRACIGPIAFEVAATAVTVEGEAFTGGHQAGACVPCEVRTPDGAILEIGLTSWEHGDRDVRCFSRLAGPLMYDRLIQGARLGVANRGEGEWQCELGILSHHQNRQPTVVKAAWTDLDSILGSSAAELLMTLGATATGTKEEVLSDTGRRRGYLVMLSGEGEPVPPLAAYILTRVLPLMSGFGRGGAVPVGLA
jgi:hypothetical protein